MYIDLQRLHNASFSAVKASEAIAGGKERGVRGRKPKGERRGRKLPSSLRFLLIWARPALLVSRQKVLNIAYPEPFLIGSMTSAKRDSPATMQPVDKIVVDANVELG